MSEQVKLEMFTADLDSDLELQYSQEGVRAGFPSPAQDYTTDAIDLNKELVRHPSSTFYARCVGDSMKDSGIDDGDLLVIDKSLEPAEGDIVVAYIDGEFTLKRIHIDTTHNFLMLMPSNPNYQPIKVTEENHFIIWGIVTYNIKKQKF
jgi:DNA polymerase V